MADIAAEADVLSFGGTKNGAVAAEAVLVMSGDLLEAVPFQRKQLLQLASKMRFLAAQFAGLLEGQTWLHNGAQSNSMARRLADGLVTFLACPCAGPCSPTRCSQTSIPVSPGPSSATGVFTSGTSSGTRSA